VAMRHRLGQKHGASRRTEPFMQEELTTKHVTERAVQVLRRAVTFDNVMEGQKP
jgi:hypothetical protein